MFFIELFGYKSLSIARVFPATFQPAKPRRFICSLLPLRIFTAASRSATSASRCARVASRAVIAASRLVIAVSAVTASPAVSNERAGLPPRLTADYH